ncbi:hypothetical protein [Emticicia fontis]
MEKTRLAQPVAQFSLEKQKHPLLRIFTGYLQKMWMPAIWN